MAVSLSWPQCVDMYMAMPWYRIVGLLLWCFHFILLLFPAPFIFCFPSFKLYHCYMLHGYGYIYSHIYTSELPTCTHFVYFVHKNGNMKFVHRIQAFVHINEIQVFTEISTLALNNWVSKINFRVYTLFNNIFWTEFRIFIQCKQEKSYDILKYCVVVVT